MVIMDSLEPQQQVVVVGQASKIQQAKPKKEYVMGVCQGAYRRTSEIYGAYNSMGISYFLGDMGKAKQYWGLQDIPQFIKPEHIQVLHPPKHGKLVYKAFSSGGNPGSDYGDYVYTPDIGYIGNDKMIFRLDVNGKIFKIVQVFKVVHENTVSNDDPSAYCPEPETWKISTTSPDGIPTFIIDNAYSVATSDYAVSSADIAGYNYLPSNINFANLTGAAVGETVGEGANAAITLDTDAAGHGWYWSGISGQVSGISNPTTPWYEQGLFNQNLADMQNWLPTSNPNEWVARAGTAAAGKMDMLSVLLHEYGHALGIDHSADAHDYMATTLTPGMRRLPSSDAMQLMAQLAGEAREAIMAGNGYTLIANRTEKSMGSDSIDFTKMATIKHLCALQAYFLS